MYIALTVAAAAAFAAGLLYKGIASRTNYASRPSDIYTDSDGNQAGGEHPAQMATKDGGKIYSGGNGGKGML